jgi:hypothetical protein
MILLGMQRALNKQSSELDYQKYRKKKGKKRISLEVGMNRLSIREPPYDLHQLYQSKSP